MTSIELFAPNPKEGEQIPLFIYFMVQIWASDRAESSGVDRA